MFVLTLFATAYAGNYAILFAGSKFFDNYRHQADIFTLYTKLIENGWKETEINIMCYDDIANDQLNPFKGQVFHETDHQKNVWPGSEKVTTRGNDVTAKNLFNALSTVPTTSEDYVFVYYNNHGGPGWLGVPAGDHLIRAPELNEALCAMEGRCKAVLFGIEACYSASLAQEFTAKNVATITAANDQESSYACSYDSQVGAYLSNEFTNYWINEMYNNPKTTVGQLFETLKSEVEGSHVCWFGDESLKELSCELFWGTGNSNVKRVPKNVDIVPQRIANLRALEHAKTEGDSKTRMKARKVLLQMNTRSEKLEIILDRLLAKLNASDDLQVRQATSGRLPAGYFEVIDRFFEKFGTVNPDDYGRFIVVKNLVAKYGAEKVLAALKEVF